MLWILAAILSGWLLYELDKAKWEFDSPCSPPRFGDVIYRYDAALSMPSSEFDSRRPRQFTGWCLFSCSAWSPCFLSHFI